MQENTKNVSTLKNKFFYPVIAIGMLVMLSAFWNPEYYILLISLGLGISFLAFIFLKKEDDNRPDRFNDS
jgi:asparagine N-glycosylation enzyme membrane subunit Stt3